MDTHAKKTIDLNTNQDLIKIRRRGRSLAKKSGFKSVDQSLIATALSEICRNVIEHAADGKVIIEVTDNDRTCLLITVHDEGPGIDNLESILQKGFSSKEEFGIGLSGARHLMDEFDIESSPEGTTVKMCKYL